MRLNREEIRIDILAFDGCMGTTVLGPIELFGIANVLARLSPAAPRGPHFRTRVVSVSGGAVRCGTGTTLSCAPAHAAGCDFLIVPGIWHEQASDLDREMVRLAPQVAHLQRSVSAGTPVAAVCGGTLLPAAGGLLDGRIATTSWWLADYFRRRFPRVRVALDRLVCVDGPVWTAGATTAYLDLCLQIVERHTDSEAAAVVSRFMLVDPNRTSQASYALPLLQRASLDPAVVKVQAWIARHYARPVTLDALARIAAVSTRTLIRRFHAALGTTPLGYLQKIRVDAAKHLIATSALPIERIVERAGYDDAGSFRRLFRAHTGLSPREYRERFRMRRGPRTATEGRARAARRA